MGAPSVLPLAVVIPFLFLFVFVFVCFWLFLFLFVFVFVCFWLFLFLVVFVCFWLFLFLFVFRCFCFWLFLFLTLFSSCVELWPKPLNRKTVKIQENVQYQAKATQSRLIPSTVFWVFSTRSKTWQCQIVI